MGDGCYTPFEGPFPGPGEALPAARGDGASTFPISSSLNRAMGTLTLPYVVPAGRVGPSAHGNPRIRVASKCMYAELTAITPNSKAVLEISLRVWGYDGIVP
jgi:hypothetical protein